jgi:hypothetical protein
VESTSRDLDGCPGELELWIAVSQASKKIGERTRRRRNYGIRIPYTDYSSRCPRSRP